MDASTNLLTRGQNDLLLRWCRGQPLDDIATDVGSSPGTVRVQLQQLRLLGLAGRLVNPVELAARDDLGYCRALGPERPGATCREPSCPRGRIRHSVCCRAHHFRMVMGRDMPAEGDDERGRRGS